MNADFFRKFSAIDRVSKPTADDIFDKLNYKYAGITMIVMLGVNAIRQYFQLIQCWIPPEWPKAWEEYAENYCWIQNTYYVNVSNSMFPKPEDRRATQLNYYQWVMFVLAIQAFLFYVPHYLWKTICVKIGYNVSQIVEYAVTTVTMDVDEREKNIKFLAKALDKTFRSRHWRPAKVLPCNCANSHHSTVITVLYIMIKILYVAGAIGQLFLMKSFLGFDSVFFGWIAAANLIKGNHWTATGMFPRVTFCDVPVRRIGQPVVRTIQCVLPSNLLNEKMYIFIWFLTITCAILSTFGLFLWTIRAVLRINKKKFIKRNLKILQVVKGDEKEKQVEKFVREYLRNDGVFVMRMISSNVGDIVAAEIVEALWKLWRESEEKKIDDDETPSIIRSTPPPDKNSEAPTMRRPNKGDSPISSI